MRLIVFGREKAAKECILAFLAKLYSKPTMSKKTVDEVVEWTLELFESKYFSFLNEKITIMLQNPSQYCPEDVDFLFENFKKNFRDFGKEKKKIQYF